MAHPDQKPNQNQDQDHKPQPTPYQAPPVYAKAKPTTNYPECLYPLYSQVPQIDAGHRRFLYRCPVCRKIYLEEPWPETRKEQAEPQNERGIETWKRLLNADLSRLPWIHCPTCAFKLGGRASAHGIYNAFTGMLLGYHFHWDNVIRPYDILAQLIIMERTYGRDKGDEKHPERYAFEAVYDWHRVTQIIHWIMWMQLNYQEERWFPWFAEDRKRAGEIDVAAFGHPGKWVWWGGTYYIPLPDDLFHVEGETAELILAVTKPEGEEGWKGGGKAYLYTWTVIGLKFIKQLTDRHNAKEFWE